MARCAAVGQLDRPHVRVDGGEHFQLRDKPGIPPALINAAAFSRLYEP